MYQEQALGNPKSTSRLRQLRFFIGIQTLLIVILSIGLYFGIKLFRAKDSGTDALTGSTSSISDPFGPATTLFPIAEADQRPVVADNFDAAKKTEPSNTGKTSTSRPSSDPVPSVVLDCTPATKPSPLPVDDFSRYKDGVTKDKPVAVFYDVHGTTASEARSQMNKCGIGGFDAHVRWDVSWDFRYDFVDSNCRVSNLKVVSTATIVMPNWQYTEDTSQTDKDRWETFTSRLQGHEDDHVEFSRMAADEVYRVLSKTVAPSCDGFADQSNTTGRDIVDDFAAQDDAYDVRKKHGATQGIFFP